MLRIILSTVYHFPQLLKNVENAKKFIDFVLSEEIQNKVGAELTVRPLRQGAKLADYMVPTEDIKLGKEL